MIPPTFNARPIGIKRGSRSVVSWHIFGTTTCLEPIFTMAPEPEQLASLSNPLATVEQLSTSSSQLDGVPAHLESSLRFAGAQLTQAAGILLRLPQEIIAQAIVIFLRFYIGSEGGSFKINAVKVRLQVVV